MVQNFDKRKNNWKESKEIYEKKINDLLTKIKINEKINIDLIKRVKMLDYEIQREKELKKIN